MRRLFGSWSDDEFKKISAKLNRERQIDQELIFLISEVSIPHNFNFGSFGEKLEMTTMTTEEIVVKLRELKPQIFDKFRITEIQLFGSNVRRQQNDQSDIDILADFKNEADLFDLTGLAIFLEDTLKQKIDIVPKKALRKELKDSIFKEAIMI